MGYQYWMLRYVPNAIRGEFVNIGVVVGGEGHDWAVRRVSSLARANRLGGNPEQAADWLRRIERTISPVSAPDSGLWLSAREDPSLAWMERLRARHNNVVQISHARPIRASDAQSGADILFRSLVLEPEPRQRPADRNQAIQHLRMAYFTAGHLSQKEVRRQVRLQSGRQRANFEFAIGRQRIAQLSQVWSFRVRTIDSLAQELQAWSYAVHRLRDQGGELRSARNGSKTVLPVESSVPVRVLFVPPTTPPQEEIFASAQDAWRDLGVVSYSQGSELALAEEAERLLRA